MALYNQLFEYNQLSPLVLEALKLDYKLIPRWRDAWFDAEAWQLVIYTRTGGFNREPYAERNDWLRSLPGFISDEDDPYDETYAFWRYAVPADAESTFKLAAKRGFGRDPLPQARWEALLADMKAGRDTPDTRRSKLVQESIARQIEAGEEVDLGTGEAEGRVKIIRIET